MRRAVWLVLCLLAMAATLVAAPQQKTAQTEWQYPVVKGAGGAVPLPNAAVQPSKAKQYKVLVDVTKPGDNPSELYPGLEHAARLLNVMALSGVPAKNIHMAVVFHGKVATAGPMNNEAYRAKFHVDNPNLAVIQQLKKAGAEIFVCGQAMHALHFENKDVVPEAKVVTAAVVVLVVYQNNGYALMAF